MLVLVLAALGASLAYGLKGSPAKKPDTALAPLRARAGLDPCPASLGPSFPDLRLPCLGGGPDVSLKGPLRRPFRRRVQPSSPSAIRRRCVSSPFRDEPADVLADHPGLNDLGPQTGPLLSRAALSRRLATNSGNWSGCPPRGLLAPAGTPASDSAMVMASAYARARSPRPGTRRQPASL